jgi:cytochrome c peroxidase
MGVPIRRWLWMSIAGVLAFAPGLAAGDERADSERVRGVDPAALSYTYIVGSFKPEYTAPPAGSYILPVIQTVTDHPVLDAEGRSTTLFALKRDRLAVVAFVYTACPEATGCPLSEAVLHRIDHALSDDTQLARQVTLITVSFDPERDTPAAMKTVRELHKPKNDWRFVTTRDDAQLQPLLADFNQPVFKLRFADGRWTGLFRHVLKDFLLDRENRVRNIYSVGFLNAQTVLNDLRTLLMQPEQAAEGSAPGFERRAAPSRPSN